MLSSELFTALVIYEKTLALAAKTTNVDAVYNVTITPISLTATGFSIRVFSITNATISKNAMEIFRLANMTLLIMQAVPMESFRKDAFDANEIKLFYDVMLRRCLNVYP
jgi:hypothetical protein